MTETGIKGSARAVRLGIHGKKSFSVYINIGGVVGLGITRFGHIFADTGHLRAVTDLGRVNLCAPAVNGLIKHIGKSSLTRFKARCVDIRNVIGDNIHSRLLCAKAGNRRCH